MCGCQISYSSTITSYGCLNTDPGKGYCNIVVSTGLPRLDILMYKPGRPVGVYLPNYEAEVRLWKLLIGSVSVYRLIYTFWTSCWLVGNNKAARDPPALGMSWTKEKGHAIQDGDKVKQWLGARYVAWFMDAWHVRRSQLYDIISSTDHVVILSKSPHLTGRHLV